MAQDTPEKSILEILAQTQTFHPSGAKLFVPDWTLDPGDVITIQSDGVDYDVPIHTMDLTWNGVSTAEIQSTGNQEREPLSALKRKEYQSRRSGYAAQKEAEEQQRQQYEHFVTETDAYRKEIYRVNGVVYDNQGNIVYQTDPETGEYILDEAGNKIPVYNEQSNGSISGQIIRSAQRMATIIRLSGMATEVFDKKKAYKIGDCVLYPDANGNPYRFTKDHDANTSWKGTGENGDVEALGTFQSQIDQNTEYTASIYGTVTTLGNDVTQIKGSTIWQNETALANLVGTVEIDKDGNLKVKDGKGLYVTGDSIINGFVKDNELDSGYLIQKINGTTEATIRADKINLQGVVTSTEMDTRLLNADALFTTTGYAGTIYSNAVNTGTVQTTTIHITNPEESTSPYNSYSPKSIYIGEVQQDMEFLGYDKNKTSFTIPDGIASITPDPKPPEGQIGFLYTTFTNSTPVPVNFNIADTAYYKIHVGISSVTPEGWLYDSTEHKYYNQVTATAKDSTQENPDTASASVFIPDITLTPVSGLTATGTVKAWGPAVSGTVYAAADDLSLYLKADDEYIYITKTDSTPVSVGPSANVIARMTNEGGGAAYTAGQANVNGQIESITHPSGDTNYLANYLNIDITAAPKLELKSNDTPPVISYITGKTNPDRITQLTDTIQIPVVVTDATLTAGEFTNGKYTITGTGGNVNVDGAGGTNIPVGVTPLTFEPTDAIEAGQQSVTPSLSVDGWRWDGPSGSETLGNSVLASNPYDTSKEQDSVITLPSLSVSVTKTGVSVSAVDKANVSGVVAVSNHTVTLDTIQETDVPVGQTPELLGDGFYALNYKKQGGTATGWAYYKVSGGTLADGTITDIILQGSKVAYDSTNNALQVNVRATGTNITNAPYDDSVSLALTSTEVVLKKGELSNKTTDPNNSRNTYAGQYSVSKDSGGTFKVEGIDTLSVDTAALGFSLELNMPTSTLGAQGKLNWDNTEHKYKYKLSSSLNVDNDSSALKRDTGELVLDPVDAIGFGHENGVADGQNAMTADGSWGTYTANTNQHTNTFTYQAYTTDTPPVAKGDPQATDVALSSGLWVGSKQTVYLKEGASILAEYEVDASDLVTNAKNAVKIEGPTWSNTGDATDANQISFSTDAPTPKSGNESLTLDGAIELGSWDSTLNAIQVNADVTVKDSGQVTRLSKEITNYLVISVSDMKLGAAFAKTESGGQTLDYSGTYTLSKSSGGQVSINNTAVAGLAADISTSGKTSITLVETIDSVSGTWDSENLQYNLSASGTVKEGNTTRLTASGTGTLVPTSAINYGKSQVGLKTPEWLDSTDDDHPNTYLISTNGRVNSTTGAANEEQTYLTPTAAITHGQNSVSAALVAVSAVPEGATSSPLVSGVYDLQRVVSGTPASHTYYTVSSGGGAYTGRFIVSSSGDTIPIYSSNGMSVIGRLYPNTPITSVTPTTIMLRTYYQFTYDGVTGYSPTSNFSSTPGATNYPTRIGWVGGDDSSYSAAIAAKPTEVTENGTYYAVTDNLDGYSSFVVNVSGGGGSSANIQTNKTVTYTANGSYTLLPSSGYDAMSRVAVTVDVPSGVSSQRTASGLDGTIVLPASHTGTGTISGNIVVYDDDSESIDFPVTIDASAVYQQGRTDGASASPRTISSLSKITLSASDVNNATKTTTATFSDSTTQSSVNIVINAKNVYDAGVAQGQKEHDINASGPTVQTGSVSGRKSAGSISGASVYNARNGGYIFFTATCGSKTQNFYITINP